jgi:hypothetical protein
MSRTKLEGNNEIERATAKVLASGCHRCCGTITRERKKERTRHKRQRGRKKTGRNKPYFSGLGAFGQLERRDEILLLTENETEKSGTKGDEND